MKRTSSSSSVHRDASGVAAAEPADALRLLRDTPTPRPSNEEHDAHELGAGASPVLDRTSIV